MQGDEPDFRDIDDSEKQCISQIFEQKCCIKKCIDNWTQDKVLRFRADSNELNYYDQGKNILDQVMLGIIRTEAKSDDQVVHARSKSDSECQRIKLVYCFNGLTVCQTAFLFLHGIKRDRLKRLFRIYKVNESITVPFHGNYKKTPSNTLTFGNVQFVVKFIQNYAEDEAMFMPGGQANTYNILKLLPTSETKFHIYELYKSAAEEAKYPVACYASFTALWRDFCSDVSIMSQKTDLCDICQKNYISHRELRNVTEEEKKNFFILC